MTRVMAVVVGIAVIPAGVLAGCVGATRRDALLTGQDVNESRMEPLR